MQFKKITDRNYIHIEGFMRTQLNLKSNELLVYAVIYGFSQDGKNQFTGSLDYLVELIGATRKTIFTTLQNLCNRNLIIKEKSGNNSIYYVNLECVKITHQDSDDECVKITHGCVNSTNQCVKITHECVKNTHNNKDINNNINNNINKKENSKTKTSTSSKSTKKSKKDKAIDLVISKFEEYDFSDNVKEKLLEFYEDRADKKDYPGNNQLTTMFNDLSEVSEQKQLEAISNSIKQGYKGIFINKNTSKKQSYRLDTTDIETVEEHNQKIAEMQSKIDNNSDELYKF